MASGMSLLLPIYNLLLHTAGAGALGLLGRDMRRDAAFYDGRWGKLPMDRKPGGSPRIWLHAASVGETGGAVPIIRLLRDRLPGAAIFLTVGTLHGYRFARERIADTAFVLPAPLDFPNAVAGALRFMDPDVYAPVESEFWPNLFHALRRREIPTLLLNGRLSDRSTKRYALLGPLFRPIFKQFTHLAMHSAEDRKNALRLGADPGRTLVVGTSKYDGLAMRVNVVKASEWRELLDAGAASPVVVGGSLRGSECLELMRIFAAFRELHPGALGVFVPRHLERLPSMIEWLRKRALPFQLLSEIAAPGGKRTAPIVVVDRIGMLFELYALGDLVFCGGSIEPGIGGHNILEPAAWGKAVFYGPNIARVQRERACLDAAEAGFIVRDADDLLSAWTDWAGRLPELRARGDRARYAVARLAGAAERQVELIMEVLSEVLNEDSAPRGPARPRPDERNE